MYHLEVNNYLTGFERIEGLVGGSQEILSVKGFEKTYKLLDDPLEISHW